MHLGNPVLNIQIREAILHRRLVYIYLLNVPSFSSRYFNKIKRTSRLGRLLALSLEILSCASSYILAAKVRKCVFRVCYWIQRLPRIVNFLACTGTDETVQM